jgi:hypothetical protein
MRDRGLQQRLVRDVPADVAKPPIFFLREFYSTWPDHYIVFNAELRVWEVWKDLVVLEPDEHGKLEKRTVPICRAVFDSLDQRALDNLRHRRWVGLNYMHSQKAYLGWLRKEEVEAKAKKRERNIEMMAEGLTKMHRMETTRTFS